MASRVQIKNLQTSEKQIRVMSDDKIIRFWHRYEAMRLVIRSQNMSQYDQVVVWRKLMVVAMEVQVSLTPCSVNNHLWNEN